MYRWLADFYFDKEEKEKAVSILRKGIEMCGISGDYEDEGQRNLYEDLFSVYNKNGEWDKAIAVLEEMKTHTKEAKFQKLYYYYLGCVYWCNNEDGSKDDSIIQLWEKAVTEQIDCSVTYGRLAEIYGEKGEEEKAVKMLEKGIELAQGSKDYVEGNLYDKLYWKYLADGRYRESLELAKLLYEDTNNDNIKANHPYKMALSSMFVGDYETAYENYKKAKETGCYKGNPFQADADMFLCCYNMGKYAEACAILEHFCFGYEEAKEDYMDVAMRSRFMLDGAMNKDFVERIENYLLEQLNREAYEKDEDKVSSKATLSELYMLKGEKALSDCFSRQVRQYYEESGKDAGHRIEDMDAWRFAYQGEYDKAYGIFRQIEEYTKPDAGSAYGEYCFFKRMSLNNYKGGNRINDSRN